MSTANLNQSLDAIIQSKSPKQGRAGRRRKSGAKNGALSSSKLGKKDAQAKPAKSNLAKATAAAIKQASAFDASKYATRVLVSGMPFDVTENQVKTYFETEIGPVAKCSGSFNSRGQSKGEFAITFRKEGHAAAAQKRFNDTPVDGGKRTIRVELVVPSQVPVSLGDRLKPKPAAGGAASTGASASKRTRNRKAKGKTADAPVPAAVAKAAGGASKSNKKKAARKTKPAKSEAELDAEMEDYYKDEITI